MGLNEVDSGHGPARSLHAWLLPAGVIALSVMLAIAGDGARDAFRYDRAAVVDGEFWRLLSGHFVHLSWSHLALNVVGLLLVYYLVAARFSAALWLTITLLTIVGIDVGFWLLEPQLDWYVGLSGLLHGLLAAGTVAGLLGGHKEAWLLLVLLVVKLGYEQLVGPMPGSVASAGGDVVVAAHLYGGLAGAALGALTSITARSPASL